MPVAPDYAPSLAASRRRRPPQRTTPKNSRLGFFGNPSGRTLGRRHLPHRTAPGYRGSRYKTASGRPKWLNADPAGLAGGLNLYAYVGNDPIAFVDPSGLVQWIPAGKATLGIITNGLGIAASIGLAAVPDPTLLTKVAAGAVALKSGYGLQANFNNLGAALFDQAPVSKGALTTDVAQIVAPGNEGAQKFALAVDLSIDLATGRISANAAESAAGTLVRDANGFPLYEMEYQYIQNPAEIGGDLAKIFNRAALAEVGIDEALIPLIKGSKNCP